MMEQKQTVTGSDYIKCGTCGSLFNPAFLDQVFLHEHKDGLSFDEINKGKKIISNARDVYPNCGGAFASGVHQFLNGCDIPARPCSDEEMQGWICAERDLKDNYILKF